MFEFTIARNTNADIDYFDVWMNDHYPTVYEGYSDNGADAFIKVISSTEFSVAEKSSISSYYASLTTSEVGDDKKCHIYEFMDGDLIDRNVFYTPIDVDYVRSLNIRLHPIITDVYKGEVREVTYYESVTVDPLTGVQTGSGPVVKEEMTYTRNADKIAQYREMKIHWFRNDGTLHPDTKIRHKYYTNEQAISEGVRRRTNIIDFMQIPLLGMMMQTIPCTYAQAVDQGGLFFEQYVVEVETYKFSPRQGTLQTAITNDTDYAWLDNVVNTPETGDTIRDYMLDQLNY